MRKIIAIFTLSLLIAFAFQPLCLSDVYTNNTLRPISAYEKEERATQYAKVDAGTHKQLLITVSKTIGATLEEQTRNACDQIRRVLEKEGVSQDFIAEQVVYMADASRRTACKDVMKKYFYGKTLPATAFIQQPPANGDQISIQLTVMYGDGVKVSRKNDNVTVVTDRARNKKICVQGVESRDHLIIYMTRLWMPCFEWKALLKKTGLVLII
ncbi:MAG: Rid family hydrolase [Candidatus Omnitrophica bacterium]|nr:Rid family hydrolase [Candidatus Omnitrophota bacterium]